MKSGVYKILNKANGNCYVGSTKNIGNRWAQHRSLLSKGQHYSAKMQSEWIEYGAQNFEFLIIKEAQQLELIALEQQYIDFEKPLYNTAPHAGTQLGVKLSDETRAKMSSVRYGKSPSEETREKMSAWQIGRKRSPETCKKISESKIAAGLKGRTPHNKGVKHSEAAKEKMRAWHRANRGVSK